MLSTENQLLHGDAFFSLHLFFHPDVLSPSAIGRFQGLLSCVLGSFSQSFSRCCPREERQAAAGEFAFVFAGKETSCGGGQPAGFCGSVGQLRSSCDLGRCRSSDGRCRRGRQAAVEATRRGMQLFTQGDVKASVVEFDKALELDPRQRPYLWQRGLSLYYLNRFEEGATQFRDDVAVNPNDTEESIWCFLCEAQLHGPDNARKRFLKVGRDSRPVMRAAYELFRDGGDTNELLNLATANAHDFFYAYLYVGLYHEAKNETEAAKEAMTAAVSSPYGSRSVDYMATLAKVHCACRGWPVKDPLQAIV